MESLLLERVNMLCAGLCDQAMLRELAGSVSCCSDLSRAIFDLFLHCALVSESTIKFELYTKLEERLHYFHVKFPRFPVVFIPTAIEFCGEKRLLPVIMSGPLFNTSVHKSDDLLREEPISLIEQLRTEFTLDRNTTVWRTFQTHRSKNILASGMQTNLSTAPNTSESVEFLRKLYSDQPRVITIEEAAVNRGLCMRMIKLSMSYFTPDTAPAVADAAWQPPHPAVLLKSKNVVGVAAIPAGGNNSSMHPYAETPSSPPPEEQGMDISAPTSPEGPASPPPEDQGLDHHILPNIPASSDLASDNFKRSHVPDADSMDHSSKRSKLDVLPDNARPGAPTPAALSPAAAPSFGAPQPAAGSPSASPLKQLLTSRMQSPYRFLAVHLLTQLDMEFDEFYPIYGDMSDVTCHFRTLFYGESHARIVNALESNSMYWHVMTLIAQTNGLKYTHLLVPVLRHLLIAHALYWDSTRDMPTSDKYKKKLFSSVMLSRIIELGCPERPVPVHMLIQTVEPRAKAVVLKLLWSLLQTWPTPVIAVGGIHALSTASTEQQHAKPFYRLQMAIGLTPAAYEEFRRVLASVAHQLRALLLKRGLGDDVRFKSLAAVFFASKTGLLPATQPT